jgi:hypothetical protein
MEVASAHLSEEGQISQDTVVDLKCDVPDSEFFPSSNRQLILDMIEGSASCDYPHTDIRKGDSMPTHPCFCKLLPLDVALYGRKSKLACHHKARPEAFAPFTTGVSQGHGTGSGFSSLPAHFAGEQALAQYPDVRMIFIALQR